MQVTSTTFSNLIRGGLVLIKVQKKKIVGGLQNHLGTVLMNTEKKRKRAVGTHHSFSNLPHHQM